MPEHYVLPKSKIGFTVIPKTGCTTLKNYLISLEQTFPLGGQATPDSEYLDMAIHSSKLASNYKVSHLDSPKQRDLTKILVLRNPYYRVLSAWANKLLYAQGDYSIFSRLMDEPFTPKDFNTIGDLNKAFEAFLARLLDDRKFLESDAHWRPQATFVNNPSNYDLVLETSSLSKLQTELAKQDHLSDLVAERTVPVFNATRTELVRLVGSEKAWLAVEQIYADDFELLKTAGFGSMPLPVITRLDEVATSELIKAEKPEVLLSRELSENRSIRSELELIKASRSWRWTGWLRLFGRPFTRFL
jgi:hypothetical protein